MFESANLKELAKVVQGVITPEVVSEGKMWKLNNNQRHKVRLAMFGPGKPSGGSADLSLWEQKEVLSQFTKKVAGPIIESLPPYTAAWAVLMLYEEFVDAVLIQPLCEADVGGGG
jgi:hypothetical protein